MMDAAREQTLTRSQAVHLAVIARGILTPQVRHIAYQQSTLQAYIISIVPQNSVAKGTLAIEALAAVYKIVRIQLFKLK